MFFLIGAFFIVSNGNLHLKDVEGIGEFYDSYFDWIGQLFNNFRSISGFVINFDWLPDNNSSFVSK